MNWRYQLPTWSPITASMLRAAARSDPGAPARLEAQLAASYGADRVLLTASGTVALTLALLSRGPCPRVAMPAWGCPDLATAADGADAVVRLYDLDPRTLGPDLDSLRRAVAGGIDLVVVASFFGVPFDAEAIAPIVHAAGGLLVDDAAQGAGGAFRGRPLGVHGDLGVLSFGRGKGRTGGSGGALLATSALGVAAMDRVAARLTPAGQGGRFNDLVALAAMAVLARPGVYRLPASLPWLRLGETIYHPPPELVGIRRGAAAALLAGEDASRAEAATRRERGRAWAAALGGSSRVRLVEPPAGSDPGWLRFPVVGPARAAAELGYLRSLGVLPGYPRLLVEWGAFQRRVAEAGPASWDGATELAQRLVTLPTHGRLAAADRRHVVAALG
ncbi:MAG: DegT/DnrJ/EryC1/StrS family aminotransferase [Gemmatimonadales bacterium]